MLFRDFVAVFGVGFQAWLPAVSCLNENRFLRPYHEVQLVCRYLFEIKGEHKIGSGLDIPAT